MPQPEVTLADALQWTLQELGEAPPETLTAHMKARYGVHVKPQFLVILRASLRDKEKLDQARQAAAAAAAAAQVKQAAA
jgi:predicted kinase